MPLLHWLAASVALAAATLAVLFGNSLPVLPPQMEEEPVPLVVVPVSEETPILAPSKLLENLLEAASMPVEPPGALPLEEEPSSREGAPAPVVPSVSLTELNATIGFLRGAVVNIVCIPERKSLGAISSTGVIIDERGIILTVAHAGQYLLLDEGSRNRVACVIRQGSPAKTAYLGELIYISESWLSDNPKVLSGKTSGGTGEFDFALIGITESETEEPLPDAFIAVPLAPPYREVYEGEQVAIGSYAAEFLSSEQISSALYPSIVFGAVKNLYTFTAEVLDLLSLQVGASAQEGSSGGVVANVNNELIGLITTRSSRVDLTERTLQAISANHIRRTFLDETGDSLDAYLAANSVQELIQNFRTDKKRLVEQVQKTL